MAWLRKTARRSAIFGGISNAGVIGVEVPPRDLFYGIHPNATRSPAEHREAIGNAFNLPVCPVHLSHRSAFGEAPANGQAPQELEPKGKAAAEIEALFAFVDQTARANMRFETAPVQREPVQ